LLPRLLAGFLSGEGMGSLRWLSGEVLEERSCSGVSGVGKMERTAFLGVIRGGSVASGDGLCSDGKGSAPSMLLTGN
jgi:hypothetical protein